MCSQEVLLGVVGWEKAKFGGKVIWRGGSLRSTSEEVEEAAAGVMLQRRDIIVGEMVREVEMKLTYLLPWRELSVCSHRVLLELGLVYSYA